MSYSHISEKYRKYEELHSQNPQNGMYTKKMEKYKRMSIKHGGSRTNETDDLVTKMNKMTSQMNNNKTLNKSKSRIEGHRNMTGGAYTDTNYTQDKGSKLEGLTHAKKLSSDFDKSHGKTIGDITESLKSLNKNGNADEERAKRELAEHATSEAKLHYEELKNKYDALIKTLSHEGALDENTDANMDIKKLIEKINEKLKILRDAGERNGKEIAEISAAHTRDTTAKDKCLKEKEEMIAYTDNNYDSLLTLINKYEDEFTKLKAAYGSIVTSTKK